MSDTCSLIKIFFSTIACHHDAFSKCGPNHAPVQSCGTRSDSTIHLPAVAHEMQRTFAGCQQNEQQQSQMACSRSLQVPSRRQQPAWQVCCCWQG